MRIITGTNVSLAEGDYADLPVLFRAAEWSPATMLEVFMAAEVDGWSAEYFHEHYGLYFGDGVHIWPLNESEQSGQVSVGVVTVPVTEGEAEVPWAAIRLSNYGQHEITVTYRIIVKWFFAR